MDRRSLLKTAFGATAVAALPMIPATAEVAVAATALPVAPPKLKPYVDYVWEWFVSHDGEVYHESFPTREAALEYAKACDYRLVSECRQQDFDIRIEGWEVIERLNEANYDQIGEGDGISCTNAQEGDLGDMLTQAMEAWAVKHAIDLRAWTFGAVRNTIDIDKLDTATLTSADGKSHD